MLNFFQQALLIYLCQYAPQADLTRYPPLSGKHQVVILGIIDGDTVDAAFLIPVRFRLHGLNAPELKEEEGAKAKAALGLMIPPGCMATVDLRGRDKFGRTLAVFIGPGGYPVNLALIGAGHAKPWDGKGGKP